jgi:hypothetical protein
MRNSRLQAGLLLPLLALLSCAGEPARVQQWPPDEAEPAWEAPREIQVLSWNLGFGALG